MLHICFGFVSLCFCSYKLGHSEVHSTGESQATPASTAGKHKDGQMSNRSPSGPDMQQSLAESSLQDRIQQLETDMTKVSVFSGLYCNMHSSHGWLVVLQVQNMLLLHSERIDSVSSRAG